MTSDSSPPTTDPLTSVIGYAESDIGMRREENQDSFGIIEAKDFKFFVVADGMGGVRGGATASQLAVSLIEAELEKEGELTRERLIAALQEANQAILEKASEEPELNGMGTTFVALGFTRTKLFIVNVGDSRAYRIRAGQISQLTEDHTLVNELVKSGSITSDQAQSHPVSHMLTRSLGPAAELEVDCLESPDGPANGDIYILCSDGLYNSISPYEIAQVSASFALSEVGPELISMANLRGGADNITAVVIEVGEGYAPPPSEEPEEASAKPLEEADSNSDNPPPSPTPPAAELNSLDSSAETASAPDPSAVPKEGETKTTKATQVAADAKQPGESSLQSSPGRSTVGTVLREYRYPLLIMALAGALTVLATLILAAPEQQVPSVPQFSTTEVPLVAAPPFLDDASSPAVGAVLAPVDNPVSEAGSGASTSSEEPRIKQDSGTNSLEVSSSTAAATEDLFVQPPTRSRLEVLAERIQVLEEKLGSFDQPISGRTAQSLGDASAKLVELQSQRDSISLEIDRANENLGKWLTVQRTLTDKNQIDLASEVAPFSKEIQETLEQFRRATWNYLQAADAGERAANASEHDARLQQLAKERSAALANLGAKLKAVSEKSAAGADSLIADLTLKRDELSQQIRDLEEEIAFTRILVGGDSTAREQAQRQIDSALQSARSELARMQQVPDSGANSQ